jgi:hypothetical protein
VHGNVNRKGERLFMKVKVRARVSVPSLEVEGRLVKIKMRCKGTPATEDPEASNTIH